MSGRARKPRRIVVDALRQIKRDVADATARWTVRSTIYVPFDQRTDSLYLRPRTPDEYPENQAAHWARLFNDMDAVIAQATEVRELARRQYHETLANSARSGSPAA